MKPCFQRRSKNQLLSPNRKVFNTFLEWKLIFNGAFFHINDGTNNSKKRSSQSNRTRSIVFNIQNIEINRDISIVNHNENIFNSPHEFILSIIIKWDIQITIFKRWKIKHFINLPRHNRDTRTKIT